MANNPITDEQLAELNRLHEAATKGMNWQEVAQFQAMITEQYQPLRQRLLAAESRLRAVVNDLGEVLVDVRRQRDAATARAEASEKEALEYIDYRNQAVISRNAMERRLEAAEAIVAGLRGALEEARKDNEELDGTSYAHPAWWRGQDAGDRYRLAAVVTELSLILGVEIATDELPTRWEKLKLLVAKARQDSERMRWILCNCELVHAGTLRNGKPVYLESLEELDAARGTK